MHMSVIGGTIAWVTVETLQSLRWNPCTILQTSFFFDSWFLETTLFGMSLFPYGDCNQKLHLHPAYVIATHAACFAHHRQVWHRQPGLRGVGRDMWSWPILMYRIPLVIVITYSVCYSRTFWMSGGQDSTISREQAATISRGLIEIFEKTGALSKT